MEEDLRLCLVSGSEKDAAKGKCVLVRVGREALNPKKPVPVTEGL